MLQVSLSLTARCQVKFAACAQASWFDPCELLNPQIDLSLMAMNPSFLMPILLAAVRQFLGLAKCQVAKLKAEAENEFTIILKTLGATKDSQWLL